MSEPDDLIYAVNEVRDSVEKVESTTSEVWNAVRRLDSAICDSSGVLPEMRALHGTTTTILEMTRYQLVTLNAALVRIQWILAIAVALAALYLFKTGVI